MTDTIQIKDKVLKVPVLPPGATHLMQRLSDEHIPFPELAAEIERFPTIAARLIALANSAWSGSSRSVTSLSEACTRLGFNVVRSTSIALAISSPFNPNRCPAFSAQAYWLDAMLVAEAAFGLAPSTTLPSPLCAQTMRTLGLLHNLGLLWLADSMADSCQKALEETQSAPETPLHKALQQHCGFDQYVAVEALAKAWALPPALTDVLGQQSSNSDESELWQGGKLLNLSKTLIHCLSTKNPDQIDLQQYQGLGIGPNEIEAQFVRLEKLQPRIETLANSLFLE